MIKSRLWLKATLFIMLLVAICSLSITLYTIPLTRDITYRMAETHASALLGHVQGLVEAKRQEIESYRAFAVETRKRELRDVTATAGYIIKNQYQAAQAGEITEKEAQQRALEQMRLVRYGNNDYLWISDFNSVLISHPDPNLNGADFSQVLDVYNNYIVPPMVEVARTKGEGFTSYWWNRLDMEEPSEKLTYSTLFEPWSWVYGTGVYLDDIKAEVDRRKSELVEELRELMREMVIGETGYMYIFSSDMTMLIHPNPEYESKNLSSLEDPKTGRPLLLELEEVASDPGATLQYLWDRPDDPGNYVYEKISWVLHNEYFDWYIASSVYTDELYSQSRFLTTNISIITGIIFLLSLTLGGLFLRKFIKPIEKLSSVALQVQAGDLKVRSGVQRNDEIGILAREFDNMIEKLDGHVEQLDATVKEKTRELADNYDKLEYANKHILESIYYARTIQQAILPRMNIVPPGVRELFILWRPKDIIGGDIYWQRRTEDGFLLAVIDCTGHGVPGAIMTMVASITLNQVVQEHGRSGPGMILKEMNKAVQSVLRQHSSDAKSDDGLDMGLCHVDASSGKLVFAGARIGLFVCENDELNEIKGDRQSIGYKSSDMDFEFTEHVVDLGLGTSIYMTTDGLIGQVGGESCLPFGRTRFAEFIQKRHHEPFSEQKLVLENILSEYQGDQEQRDDITVVGFKCQEGGRG